MQATTSLSSRRQHKVADPILNEKAVLNDLDRVSSLKTAEQLKHAAQFTIIGAFDRQIDRDPFIELVQTASGYAANLSRLELLAQLSNLLTQGKLNEKTLETAIKAMTKVCEERRAELVKQFTPITEMRLDGDKVH